MKQVFGYVRDYFIGVDKRIFLLSSFFISLFIFINYYTGLNKKISVLNETSQYFSWYLVFLIAFSFAYVVLALFRKEWIFKNLNFLLLLLIAPAIFSWKMVGNTDFKLSTDPVKNVYWNHVIYWPFKLVLTTALLFLTWKLTKEKQPFYGLSVRKFSARPYILMLLIMIPLIAAASTQPDFLAVYPKLKNISFLKDQNAGLYKLIYELSYGSDFFTIELFFRGFLVLAFCKWFGKDAILPMACFYCTIHFGKPLGECISSYFGGLILGAVTYHTRTIYGGLMVHLGIAWMMELGGYLGNLYR